MNSSLAGGLSVPAAPGLSPMMGLFSLLTEMKEASFSELSWLMSDSDSDSSSRWGRRVEPAMG